MLRLNQKPPLIAALAKIALDAPALLEMVALLRLRSLVSEILCAYNGITRPRSCRRTRRATLTAKTVFAGSFECASRSRHNNEPAEFIAVRHESLVKQAMCCQGTQ